MAWHWISNQQSVENGELSVLAVVETILAVITYWAIAWWFDTHRHLLISVLVAPLLLLRSPQSIEEGARRFYAFWQCEAEFDQHESPFARLFVVFSLCCTVTIFWLAFVEQWVNGCDGWYFILRSSLVGIVVLLAAIAGSVAIYGFGVAIIVIAMMLLAGIMSSLLGINEFSPAIILSSIAILLTISCALLSGNKCFESKATLALPTLPIAIGLVAGVWLRSLFIRTMTTLRFVAVGITQFPDNWLRTIYIIDFLHLPEIVPGINNIASDFRIETITKTAHKQENAFFRMTIFLFLLILIIPALLYRWSLKSTCWLYLPVVYLFWPRRTTAAEDEWLLDDLNASRTEAASRVLAVAAIISTAWFTFNLQAVLAAHLALPKAPAVLLALWAFDLHSLAPWQGLTLASAAVTIFLFFFSEKAREAYRRDISYWLTVAWLDRCARLRTLATLASLALALGYVVLALGEINLRDLPGWLQFLDWLYGRYL